MKLWQPVLAGLLALGSNAFGDFSNLDRAIAETARPRPADTLPRFAKRPAALDRGRYDRFAQFLKDEGLIDTVPEFDSYTAVAK